jgi:hypothetical protein
MFRQIIRTCNKLDMAGIWDAGILAGSILLVALALVASCDHDFVLADAGPGRPIDTPPPSPKTVLARVTFYTPDDEFGDLAATGVRLRPLRHCAVDPDRIPFGSQIYVPGIGTLTAVDTGTAVKSRKAARLSGRTAAERQALVIDVFVADADDLDDWNRRTPDFCKVQILHPAK